MKNLNAELYANELLDTWSKKNHLLKSEEKLIPKYFTDKTKKVLDVGTGGGRLAFYVEQLGFNKITAFDIVPEMIDEAKKIAQKRNSVVNFEVSDASDLPNYESESFDYLMYMQQILCFIPEDKMFKDALKESYRIAKKDATVLFAFLDYDTRSINKPLNLFMNSIRKIRKEKMQNRRLPWVKINNKVNLKMFNKNQAYVYWAVKDEIIDSLKNVGYSIIEVKNASQFEIENSTKRSGMLYVICKK